MDNVDISQLTDDELLSRTKEVARDERGRMSDLVELLAEIDERKLFRSLGYDSTFMYCVCALRYSESAAYRRIRAARALRLFPPIGVLLRDGRLNLETVALLHPHLGGPDAARLVREAAGMRVWEVERLLSTRAAPAPARDVMRFVRPLPSPPTHLDALPLQAAAAVQAQPAAAARLQAVVAPTGPVPPLPSRAVRVSFTADKGFYALLQRARAVMRHKYPDGRLEGVLRDALDALLDKKDWDRRAARSRVPPSPDPPRKWQNRRPGR